MARRGNFMTERGILLTAIAAVAMCILPLTAARAQDGAGLRADPYGAAYLPPGVNPKDQEKNLDPALAVKPDAKALTPMTPGINGKDQKVPTEAPWLAMEKKLEANHKANAMDGWYVGPVAQGDEISDMAMPHRSQKEVADWLVLALSEIMSIDSQTYIDHLKQLQSGLADHAVGQLEGFMEQSNILKTMKDQNLVLRCYVEDPPILLNKGAVDGRYRWLFDVAVNLSLMPPDTKSYENTQPINNQHVIMRMQVGRTPKGQGIDQLMMETFEVRQNPNKTALNNR